MKETHNVRITPEKLKEFREKIAARKEKIRKEFEMTDEDWNGAIDAAFSGFAGMSVGGAFTCDFDFLHDASPDFIEIFCEIIGAKKSEMEAEIGKKAVSAVASAMLKSFELGATIMAIRAGYHYDGPDVEPQEQEKKRVKSFEF